VPDTPTIQKLKPADLPRSLRIVNPPEGHNSYIGRKHALRLLKQGRGRLENSNTSIRFCDASQSVLAARNAALWCERQRKRLAAIQQERGYDGVKRPLRLEELKAIPFAGDVRCLI